VDSIIKLANSSFRGVIHIAGSDALSRFDFACLLASAYDKEKRVLISKSTKGLFSLIASNASLDTSLAKTMKFQSPDISRCVLYALNVLKYPYFSFVDSRGKIVGLSNKLAFLQMNMCETAKGSIRGNHYHRIAKELFYIMYGRIRATLVRQNEFKREFNIYPGDILQVEPLCIHAFEALEDSCWINVLTTDSVNGDIEKVNDGLE
jgi:quercetin dioxygenase-like cupin family protein